MSAYLKRLQIDSVEEFEEDPSAYLKRVDIVEVVDENDNIWQFDPLKIAENGGSNWIGGNVYEVGETVTAKTAIYTGGKEPVEYRYIFAMRDDAQSPWVAIDGGFKPTTNAKNSVSVVLQRAGQVALQSDAVDSSFPPIKVDSDTGPRTVNGIGDVTATVFDNPYDLVAAPSLTVLTQDPIAVAVQKSGSADVTYNWTARSPATVVFSNQIGASTDATIATAGVATVQCTVQSLGEIETITIQFFAVASQAELDALS